MRGGRGDGPSGGVLSGWAPAVAEAARVAARSGSDTELRVGTELRVVAARQGEARRTRRRRPGVAGPWKPGFFLFF